LLNDGTLIVVRLGVLALLYLFLAALMRVAWRDVASAVPGRRGALGRAFLTFVDGSRGRFQPSDRTPIEGEATIGRDSDNQIVVDDTTVSGRHAAIEFRGGRWWLEDLGSTNGTWVNQRRVTDALPVESGDVIQVGRVSLRLSS